jgi:hypothetical protein
MTARTAVLVVSLIALPALAAAGHVASHAPMRPLPAASDRPLPAGPAYHVDPVHGRAAGDGSARKPWRTIEAAVKRLHPGDTLYLHGGTYFENVTVALTGTAKAPITIRSMPGELAIIDGGLREFAEAPRTAWEPAPGGAPGEFRSIRAFPAIRRDSDAGRGVWVLGNFADSMIPLHGYRFEADLRSDNQIWNVPDKVTPGQGIYVGPGVWFDWQTHRIHVRLAHTRLAGQPANYAGETDPRKLALVIGVDRSALRLDKASHVRIQDLVLRGSATRTLEIVDASHIDLDGVTIYGGSPAMYAGSTHHLRMVRSVLRGTAAPWSSRASMKYRGNSPYLFIAGSQRPQSHDWELAFDEFTDGHDGIVIDSVKTLAFHHNRLDNLNDDGIYLTLPPRASVPEGIQIHENLVTRVYTTLAFAETGDRLAHPAANPAPNTIGPGVYLYRNVFDLRDGTYGWIPEHAAGAATLSASRMCGDHGSPIWEPLFFYHNTVISPGNAFRDYYGGQMVMGTRGTKRRLFNNIFVQVDGDPGLNLPGPADDVQADGNLLWGLRTGPSFQGDFFAARKTRPGPAGFGANDRHADPKLVHLVDGDPALDLRPAGGGVVDAGVALPATWPDSLRAADRGKPDIGALPLGAPMLRVGPAAAPSRWPRAR